jgi:hypothetical protein
MVPEERRASAVTIYFAGSDLVGETTVSTASESKKREVPWIYVANVPKINVRKVPKQDDFTILVQVATHDQWNGFVEQCGPEEFKEQLKRLPAIGNEDIKHVKPEEQRFSISETVQFGEASGGPKLVESRALICLCNRGESLSITARVMCPLPGEAKKKHEARQSLAAELLVEEVTKQGGGPFQLKPKSTTTDPTRSPRSYPRYVAKDDPKYFCGFGIICDLLWASLFKPENLPPQGLLVISGLTSSGKSMITRGLIWLLIAELLRRQGKSPSRCVHLLTFEDPIEAPIFSLEEFPLEMHYEALEQLRLDCTPREWEKDTSGLDQVLRDALRQTPSVVYVGEVRDLKDWKAIFEFAGTGHFIVATTHAGTLTETFTRLFQATRAKTPADKGIYAQRLCGVINLRMVKVTTLKSDGKASETLEVKRTGRKKKKTVDDPETVKLTCVLPAVWRRTPGTVARLVSDGLASLLPARANPKGTSKEDDTGCYGRGHFAARVVEKVNERDGLEETDSDDKAEKNERWKLVTAALRHDLRGE